MTQSFANARWTDLPPTCSVAFKEWAGICRALAQGRQSVILRKGGIAEDSGTFEPEHRAFWLFPTHLHEPQQGLREEVSGVEPPESVLAGAAARREPRPPRTEARREPRPPKGITARREPRPPESGADFEPHEPGIVPIRALATVDAVLYLDDPALLGELEPWHVWTEETVLKRFAYRRPGLWVLGVRVWVKAEAERLEDRADYAGCRSWVPLEREIATGGLSPVVSDEEHAGRMGRLVEVLGRSVPDEKEGAGRAG